MGVSEQCILSTTDFILDSDVIEDNFSVGGLNLSGEMALDVLPIFLEFMFTVRESKFDCFDGGIPSAGPLAAHLDLFGWLRSTKGYFSRSHASKVLFRSRNMVQ